MNAAHTHLLLNHFPTVGFVFALAIFGAGLVRRSDELCVAGLTGFFVTAALTIATYVSGNDAQQTLKDVPGLSLALMDAHENAALVAFAAMQLTGLFSWIGLWTFGSHARIARWNLGLVLILALVAFGMMARAANIGGEIRHQEIQNSTAILSLPAIAGPWRSFVDDHSWVWPACETIHFIGLSLLLGVVVTVNLRMLGMGKRALSFSALYQLLPLGMIGFTLNLVTGMMFFVAKPEQYTGGLFFLKMMLVVAGAVNLLYFMLSPSPRTVSDGHRASATTKFMAASAIGIWIAILFCGHMLPWLGNSF